MINALPPAVRGILWMVIAAFFFASSIGLVRHLSVSFTAFEVVFYRQVFGSLFMLPWLARAGLGALRTKRIGLYCGRTLAGYTGMVAWYYAITLILLADASALQFTLPLFSVIFAVAYLKEIAGPARWLATVVGFAGALVIIRPGFAEVNLGAFLALASAALYAAGNIATKALSRTEATEPIVFYSFVLHLPIAALPMLFVGTWPQLADLPWILAFGLVSVAAQWTMTLAFRAADASLLAPVDFLRLTFIAMIGFVFYAEIPEIWTWLGAAIIFAATYVLARHESAQSREAGAT